VETRWDWDSQQSCPHSYFGKSTFEDYLMKEGEKCKEIVAVLATSTMTLEKLLKT